jgi:lysophospholipase L1-like esterase
MKISKKELFTVSIVILIISLSLVLFFEDLVRPKITVVRVACLGDSITEITEYPRDLQAMLASNYIIGNFGVSGSTVLLNTFRPYLFEIAYQKAETFLPNVAILMLGTNDARTDFNVSLGSFVGDYEKLISSVQTFETKPKIYLVLPPPIFNNALNLSNDNLVTRIIPYIRQVANETDLTVIDVYSSLANHPEYFPDGVHPNNEGAQIIANVIYQAIVGKTS